MCTYNITVNEKALSRMRPAFSRESFGEWLQHHVDQLVAEMSGEPTHQSPIARTEAEAKELTLRRGRDIKAGRAKLIPDEELLEPYTMEELNAMIDESERQIAAGQYKPIEEVFRRWDMENVNMVAEEGAEYGKA